MLCDLIDVESYLAMPRDEIRPVVSTWENVEEFFKMKDGGLLHFSVVVHAE